MSTHNGPNIVENGLILHLDAANIKSYPGSGTTWFDISTNKYIFNTTNAPTFTTDVKGNKCFEFSGTGKFFESTTNSPFSGNQFAISVIAVVNQFSTADFYGILTQAPNNGFNAMAFLSLNGRFGTDHWSPGGRRIITAANNNEIYCVAWTITKWQDHQTTSTKIYLNAIEQPTESYSVDVVGSVPLSNFIIGNWQTSRADMSFQGRIYSLQAYNRELSAAEISQNFNAIRGRYGI